MTSGLLVAAMMVTPISSWTPSISFNKLVSTPSWDDTVPPSESDREVPSASISSYHKEACVNSLVTYEAGKDKQKI